MLSTQSILRNDLLMLITDTRNNGGSSVSLTGQVIPDHGYMVGVTPNESLIFDAGLLADDSHNDLVIERIRKWLVKHSQSATDPDVFLGMWIDRETNEAYVDLSIWYRIREHAISDAKRYGELAIWDLAESKEIRVA